MNKEKTEEICRVRKGIHTYMDMEHIGYGPDNVAYIVVSVHNLNVKISLAQDGIFCERVKQ